MPTKALGLSAAILFLVAIAIGIDATAAPLPKEGEKSPPVEAGSIFGRSGKVREKLASDGGATHASEVAVAKGLKWLARQQSADGRWKLDGNFPDKGNANDVAGTAFGLLPFLGAGMTHKADDRNNPFDKVVDKGLSYLLSIQNPQTGSFAVDMYTHGLCTIAICEAYALSEDKNLKAPAQRAVDYIVNAQHAAGGWRYQPGQAGDTSVTGWHIMALVTAKMAKLNVPAGALTNAANYLESNCEKTTEGYGYTGPQPTPTMTAVACLGREYLESWGPQNHRLIKSVDNYLKPNPPAKTKNNVYYYYYATQVMHHFGGLDWKTWNTSMRDILVKSQDVDEENTATFGSWSSQGDNWGRTGGRLMITSLNLLTLEVYYRHVPMWYKAKSE
jgi:hypothetical protein